MLTDSALQLSGSLVGSNVIGQSLAGTGVITSTNNVDLLGGVGAGASNPYADAGRGNSALVLFEVMTTFTGGTSTQFAIVVADDAAISVNVEVLSSKSVPLAQLVAGTRFAIRIARAAPYPPRRYLAVQYTNTGTMTAGAVVASLVESSLDTLPLYANGFAVL